MFVIGVGIGATRPRPPNRTGGFPAYGSPVGGFFIETVSLLAGPGETRPADIREGAFCHLRRCCQRRQHALRPCLGFDPRLVAYGPSASCLASSALTMLFCLDMIFARPPSCPAFPRMGFACPSFSGPYTRPQRYYAGSDSSPARTRRRGLSVPFGCLPGIPSPTTLCSPEVTYSSPRASGRPSRTRLRHQ